jgi:hypothetical protein
MLCTAIKQPQNSFNVKFHVLVYDPAKDVNKALHCHCESKNTSAVLPIILILLVVRIKLSAAFSQ